jgi:two-component system LytT family response regulator
MTLKTLIVDDEPLARRGLRTLLAKDPDISSIAEARDGNEAVSAILDWRPDLVFLDVQMPEMDGFAVLEKVGAARMPAVVFVTAHDRYAIREINAIDYLLKPVTRERFVAALQRAKTRVGAAAEEESRRSVGSLIEMTAPSSRSLKRLAVKSAGKTIFVNVEEIDWIQAAGNYVELHCGKSTHLLLVTIGAIEEVLDTETFIRIHRSIILNIRAIKEISVASHGEHVLVLTSGLRVQSSRGYHDRIRSLISNPF